VVSSRPTGQATLNASHPLAGRLVHGYVFSNGSGTVANIVNPTITASLAGSATWTTNANGACIDTGGGHIDAGVSIAFPQAPFHIVVGYSNPVISALDQQYVIAAVPANGAYLADNNWGLNLGWRPSDVAWTVDANAYWAAQPNPNPASYHWYYETQAAAFASGSHHIHLACTTSGSTMYRNGTVIGTAGVTLPGTNAQPLTFGSLKTGQYNFDAQFEYVYIFSGTLTTQEIDDLRTDPYALVGVTATRFYLPSTGTAAINPAFDAAWNDTSQVVSRPANITKGTSSFVEVTDTEASNSNLWDVCLGRFISEPIAAQTITGTVRGYIRARENVAGVNARSQMVVRVVSNDGSVVRGTLYAQDNRTVNESEWVTTTTVTAARNARFPTTQAAAAVPSMTSVTAQDGDRIVIEVGGRAVNTVTTNTFTLAMRFGENAADLAENETGTTEGAPWVEFDSPIQFQQALSPHSISGGLVSPKPVISGILTQTFPARSISGGMVSKKPTISGSLVQAAISPHSVSGALVSPKPRVSGTLTQTFPARSISGGMVSQKPIAVGTLTQSAISPHSISGGMLSPKPIVSGILGQTVGVFTDEFTDEFEKTPFVPSLSGGLTSPKPKISGTLSQGGISPHALLGGLVSQKPIVGGTLTQTFPARSVSGALVSPKPLASGTLTQTFPARSVSGALISPKPSASGDLTQEFPARSVSGGLLSKKPIVAGTLTQSAIAPHAISGGAVSNKPIAFGLLTQSSIAPHSLSGGMVSPKPVISGVLTQGGISPHSVSGEIVSPTPRISGDMTQGGISPHSLLGGLVSPKPTVSGIITDALGTFSDEFSDEFYKASSSFSGSLASPKPQISGSLSQGEIGTHSLLGGLVSPKPIVGGTLTQSFPERSISGGVVSPRPLISGFLNLSGISPHSFFGGMVSKKPQISGTLSQGEISPHILLGGLVLPKPVVSGTLTQTFPARSFSGSLVSAKPRISGTLTQTFPARSISGALVSLKPTTSGQLFQGALFGYEFSGGLISAKPQIGGNLTQTLLPSNISGSLVSAKPIVSGTLTQTPLANFLTGALASPKPKIVGLIAQGQIGASSFSAVLVSQKPRIAGSLTQSAIAAQTFSGGLISSKPRIAGTLIQQALGGFELLGGLISSKPRVLGTLTQSAISPHSIFGGMVSKKPAITGTLTQTRLPHAIGGGMVSPRPRLSGSFIQNLLTPHVISGGMVSPKPTMKAVPMADEYAVKAGIEYATKGQLALASGYLLLLVTDPEGELPMAHPIAIAQRTVEAGYGASPLTFEGPLDPAELKYFTVTWDTELQAAVDSIVPDNGTVEGQSVFLTLAEPAVATGIQVHAFSQDERSVTFWLKVEASQRGRTQWSGAGELHVITIRIITVRGQVFERDISFRVKQL
jgi:microcompartment protein CcmK/EutM